jgi:hypothetical protein
VKSSKMIIWMIRNRPLPKRAAQPAKFTSNQQEAEHRLFECANI